MAILAYFIRRVLQALVTLVVITYVVFFLTTQNGVAILSHLSVTDLLPADYLIWLRDILHGNWGNSNTTFRPVLQTIGETVPISLLLVVPALILQEVLAIGMGVLLAGRYRSWGDRIYTSATFAFAAIPQFWLAVEVAFFIGVQLNWLPFQGLIGSSALVYGTPDYWSYFHLHTSAAILDILRHLILPVTLLALVGAAADSQLVRLAMVEALNQEYVRSARAHGLPRRSVVWKHAFRNAIVPLITNLSVQIPNIIFLGAVIEYIFRLPGLGELLITAGYNVPGTGKLSAPPAHDFKLISGYFLLLGVVTVVAGFIGDSLAALADPRIRSDASSGVTQAISPQWSTRRVVSVGRASLTTGRVAVAALVLAVSLCLGLSVQHLLAPPPTLAGTWVGESFNGSSIYVQPLPMLIQFQEIYNGPLEHSRLQGTVRFCDNLYDPKTPLRQLTGSADKSTFAIDFSDTTSVYDAGGSYADAHGAIRLNGFFGQRPLPGTISSGYDQLRLVFHRGTFAEFQQACKASS
ncbi:MAG: ABC transporter permease [Ktedonobacterales bacterium]|nr:ABC transporter permease [Ktedonobacterales bacterium]